MRFTSRLEVPVPVAELFRWHARPGAFERLTPPWQPVRLRSHEGIRDGDRAVIRLGGNLVGLDWVAEHQGYDDACLEAPDAACRFEDVQVSGPFAAWRHTHTMRPTPRGSELEDAVSYELPAAPLSHLAEPLARAEFEKLFGYRHRITHADLTRHVGAGSTPLTVAITGASGTIGRQLAAFLQGGGHTVVRLVRRRGEVASRGPQDAAVYWNVEAGEVDVEALGRHAPDAVVHLAGAPITGLDGTAAARRRVWESRTKGTQLLARALAVLPRPPRVLVSASASGIFGDRGDEVLTEASRPGEGFLPDACRAWEASTAKAEAAGIRVAHARIGLVVTPTGGLLRPLAPVTALGLGGWPGDGAAFWPWIALEDVVYALHHLILDDRASGPVHLSAPTPVRTRAFVEMLADVQGRRARVSVPEPLVRAAGGELARRVALASVRMVPERLLELGFRFALPDLRTTLCHQLGRLVSNVLPSEAPVPVQRPPRASRPTRTDLAVATA